MPGAGVRIEGGALPFVTEAQVQEAALGAVREASARGASRIKDMMLTARDSRGYVGRKDLGLAHDAVGSSEPQVVGAGRVQAVTGIGPPRDQIAGVLEDGRRPGARMPPPDSLKPWIKRKLRNAVASQLRGARVTAKSRERYLALAARAALRGGTLGKGASARVTGVGKERIDKAADSLAFVIARSIGRRGIPGLHAFARTRAIMEKQLPAIFQRHLRRVLSKGKAT